MITINLDKCVGCGICTAVCPREALEAWWGHSEVDPEKCTDCFGGVFLFGQENPEDNTSLWKKKDYEWDRLCVQYCPVQAITGINTKRARGLTP